MDKKGAQLISAAPFPDFSNLNPRLSECLSALHCLPYFIQYLEYCKSVRLLHFLFACDSFRDVAEKTEHNSAQCDSDCLHQIGSPTRSIKSSLQHDALDIYVKFISMNAPHSIVLPENIRQGIENKISTEDGKIDYRCFDDAVNHVRHSLSSSFVPKFHKSSFCTAYQIDVLNKVICLADILHWEPTLVVLMEYLEQKGNENHILFWISVSTFQKHLQRAGTATTSDEVGTDAIALYDTYLSLQARKPVNYGRIIRGIVESSICPDDGYITPDAFQIAQQYCYHYIDKYFFSQFQRSDRYKAYIKELCVELAVRRSHEQNVRNASGARTVMMQQDAVNKMEALSVNPPSPKTPIKQTTSPPSTKKTPPLMTKTPPTVSKTLAIKTPTAAMLDTLDNSPSYHTPVSSYRSSPTSSRASSPRSQKMKSVTLSNAPEHMPEKSTIDDLLDDKSFWSMPRSDYRIGAVDQWGVYQTEDKHLLNSPPQGSDKIKKSVMKLFGKEDITEEDAMAQAKSIVADVMNLTSNPLQFNEFLEDQNGEQ